MPKNFPVETVQRAERLYCVEGHSFSEVQARTGVSLRMLKYWGKKFEWTEKRHENSRVVHEIRARTNLLSQKLIENCLKTLDAKDVQALVAMGSLARKYALDDAKRTSDLLRRPPCRPPTVQDGIKALEDACLIRMNQLQADPEQLDVRAIQGIEAAFDLAGRYRSRLSRAQGFLEEIRAATKKL